MILIGNSFPLSLIRRKVVIEPQTISMLREKLGSHDLIHSFWGHRNTLSAAKALIGCDLTPKTERPALQLSPNNLPMLNGQTFDECWIVSPQYIENFRPAVGEEVSEDKIASWQVLRMEWE